MSLVSNTADYDYIILEVYKIECLGCMVMKPKWNAMIEHAQEEGQDRLHFAKMVNTQSKAEGLHEKLSIKVVPYLAAIKTGSDWGNLDYEIPEDKHFLQEWISKFFQ